LLAQGAVGYHAVSSNPTVEQALTLSSFVEDMRPLVIVAVGGGSAIDLAKAGRLLPPASADVKGALRIDPPELVAVPTTAGSGSEVTPFATLYADGRKVSLDTPKARPDRVVLDGALIASAPPRVTAAAALDALCHAIESCWNRVATPVSRRYADLAADALVRLTAGRLAEPVDEHRGEELLLAAHLAGAAIAQTRTTGAHAFSYHLTARYGLAHGFACATSLVWLAAHNWQTRSPRDHGLAVLLRRLGCHPEATDTTPVAAVERLLLAALAARLVRLPRLTSAELSAYVKAGLAMHDRADLNPVSLRAADVRRQIERSGLFRAT
jgi:alcohol dehydrogenase class IV